ncbi:MAG TPA: fatty acid desaturase [Planctomycetota bacterium]|nr:fatty acid desaturase [Planctomycetota bacterium]
MPSLLRDPRDRLPVLCSVLPPLLVLVWPSWLAVAFAVWWTGNTVAHQAVHRRFWRRRRLEGLWSLWLSLLLGVPQQLWRQRHLAHHAARPWRWRGGGQLVLELAVLAGGWVAGALLWPGWLWHVYVPGLGAGLALAWLHGHEEHRGGTTSVYAAWWNRLFLNDGYHIEHHEAPARHYRDLPRHRRAGARASVLPPVLRWLEALQPAVWLAAAERLVLRRPWLRERVLAAHRRALRAVCRQLPSPRRVVIVGGGLFPRTAILLRELLPAAELVVLDENAQHLESARPWLPDGVVLQRGTFAAGQRLDADLVVLPLALRGDRAAIEAEPPAPWLLVHAWFWQRRGEGRVVAWWLGKRVYLVRAAAVLGGVQPA